jgi:hypothetical protein
MVHVVTVPAHTVPRESGWLGTVISDVYTDAINSLRMTYFAFTRATTVPHVETTKQTLSQS